jgi:hypothetical protein
MKYAVRQARKYGAQIVNIGGKATVVGGGLLMTQAANAGIYDSLTAAVDFTDLTAAMGVVYAGIVVVGIFMLGADIITKKLGWRK